MAKSSEVLPNYVQSFTRRFEGSPFEDNFIYLPEESRHSLSAIDRFYHLCSYYRPGYVSSTIILLGIIHNDIPLVGAGFCSLLAEAGASNINSAYTNVKTSA